MKYTTLGKTGLKVSVVGLGGIPVQRTDKAEAVEIVTHLAFYCGWPKAWSTFPMIEEIWPEDEVE